MIAYLFFLQIIFLQVYGQYEASWDSIDSRPLPEWYDKAKVGIFLHWGVYSVPSFGGEWFWSHWKANSDDYVQFMENNFPPNFTYQDFAREFTAEFFDPDAWADLFSRSGAQYIVLTSKHHEGYTLWPSKYSFSWNAQDVGPNRDLLGELATAVRAKDLHFGVYHSLYEWFNPIYLEDKANNWTTSNFVDGKIILEMKELINDYEPEVLWSDGDWEAPDTYWKSTEFLAWLYNDSPVKDVVVTNDRWGEGTGCQHGGFLSCQDRYNPGQLLPRKWENAMTIDRDSWGYRRNINITGDILTIHELITTLVQTISYGGNILINVGPTKEGTIIPIFQERLLQVGEWLAINGEAIYESTPWTTQNDTFNSNVYYTSKGDVVYAIILEWPKDDVVILGSAPDGTNITLLGNEDDIIYKSIDGDRQNFTLPEKSTVASEWVWILRFTNE